MPQMHKYPTSFQTTDSVIIKRETGEILLGRKPMENAWRFPGGFVDPADVSLEAASKREMIEECGDLECSEPIYLGSIRVPDPRYAEGPDKIMSAIFVSHYLWGKERAGDDLESVIWFPKNYILLHYKALIMPCHHPIIELLISHGYL